MNTQQMEVLPAEIVWRDDGHLTDVALDAYADGEFRLLETRAMAHVDACPGCTQRLGRAALASLEAGNALVVRRDEAIARRDRRRAPFPKLGFAAALVVAAASALPQMLAPEDGASKSALGVAGRMAWLLVGGAWEPTHGAIIAQALVAAVFLAVGVVIAVRARRAAVQRGGR